MQKTVYITGLNQQSHYVPITGDSDYIAAIQAGLKSIGVKTTLLGEQQTEDQVLESAKPVRGSKPVLHFLLNYQTGTGLGHTPEKLKAWKEKTGGEIVLTNIEFRFYEQNFKEKKFDEQAFAYFPLADRFTFIDEADRQTALRLYREKHATDAPTIAKLEAASIIPVPSTVKLKDETHNPEGRDIAFLGMIRPDKGIEHVVQLAQLLKHRERPERIVFIGAASRNSDTAEKLKDTELAKLMRAMYPDHQQELAACADYQCLVKLAETLAQSPAAIPIKLCLNKHPACYPAVLSECSLAFAPDLHGASLHNTAKNSFISAGVPVVTYCSDITPAELRAGGCYHNAMVLLEKDPSIALKDTPLAEQMLGVLEHRDSDPAIVEHTLAQCGQLARQVLSPQAIAMQMAKSYDVPLRRMGFNKGAA